MYQIFFVLCVVFSSMLHAAADFCPLTMLATTALDTSQDEDEVVVEMDTSQDEVVIEGMAQNGTTASAGKVRRPTVTPLHRKMREIALRCKHFSHDDFLDDEELIAMNRDLDIKQYQDIRFRRTSKRNGNVPLENIVRTFFENFCQINERMGKYTLQTHLKVATAQGSANKFIRTNGEITDLRLDTIFAFYYTDEGEAIEQKKVYIADQLMRCPGGGPTAHYRFRT